MEFGLIGEKLKHSYSVKVHGAFANYNYVLKELPKEDLENFIKAKDFVGINVTLPYKKDVLPYLDGMSFEAKKIGAVNTIVNKDGKLFGYNTDYFGLKFLIESSGFDLDNKAVAILGTGGTSLTAKAVASDLGAKQIINVSRSGEINYSNVYDIKNIDIIINTTPVGMYPNTGYAPLDLKRINGVTGVIDCIYNPLKTMLVLTAERLGIKAVGGLGMLVAQGGYASKLFTGKEICGDDVIKAYETLQKQIENLVLIGMPGSGKTSIGQELSKKLKRQLIDTDEEIVKREGRTIPEIFEKDGEEYFRNLESQVIKEISLKTGVIIATGGGAVLRAQNVFFLKQNGKVFYIDRAIDSLATDGRPLSIDKERLREMFIQREKKYKLSADEIIDNNGDIDCAIEQIMGYEHEDFSN